jgi:dTDP-D-glucose 4,6-dehydratase
LTWLDRQPRTQVDAALTEFAADPTLVAHYHDRAGNDRRYALWLAMVDGNIETLPHPHRPLT